MSQPPALRPATAADSKTCFAIFRRSLWDFMRRTGYMPADEPDPDIEAQWPPYIELFDHLAKTCARWWIAEDADGRAVGYARSTLRSSTLELTEFFVGPGARVAGVGRALLERAFPFDHDGHRSIIATVDAPAVALYLRFGVAHQTTGVDIAGRPRAIGASGNYDVAPATLDEVLAMEAQVLGHARPQDVAYMLADRPAVVLRREGRSVAYAFGPSTDGFAGPIAALHPTDLCAALAELEGAAHAAGMERLELTVPLAATTAVDWLLNERGWRVDPFYCLFLTDGPWAKLDRYLPFNPCLML
ncbi:MAG: GNAT family N-acetyltransferase [Actinomycetota bacterium]|nr:GNAT family N-acetyltransferase [Actinomycetota bacterium]